MQSSERSSIGRRLAAIGALALLGGALAAVAFAVVRGGAWKLIVTVALVAVAIAGLWYAMTQRSTARVAGALAALAAVGLAIAIALSGRRDPLLLVLALLLALLSGWTARYALRRDTGSLQAAMTDERVPPASHPVLLMNPRSGNGAVGRYQLLAECEARGIEPVVLAPGDDLSLLAEDAVRRGADVIGMAGGDGSQAVVASVARRHGVPYACVPAGTRNHFALDLGLDRADVVGALDAFSDAVERRVDLAMVNGRVFVNNATLGAYAKVVQSPTYRGAKARTTADVLPDVFGDTAVPFDLRFTGPDGVRHPTAHVILVANNPYQLDYRGGRGTRERLDRGVLGIVAATVNGPREAAAFAALEAAGRIRDFPGWLEWAAERFTVESGDRLDVGLDGEALVLDPPLVFESLPRALRVRLPARARRHAPAASSVHMTRSTVRELVAIALGRDPLVRGPSQ